MSQAGHRDSMQFDGAFDNAWDDALGFSKPLSLPGSVSELLSDLQPGQPAPHFKEFPVPWVLARGPSVSLKELSAAWRIFSEPPNGRAVEENRDFVRHFARMLQESTLGTQDKLHMIRNHQGYTLAFLALLEQQQSLNVFLLWCRMQLVKDFWSLLDVQGAEREVRYICSFLEGPNCVNIGHATKVPIIGFLQQCKEVRESNGRFTTAERERQSRMFDTLDSEMQQMLFNCLQNAGFFFVSLKEDHPLLAGPELSMLPSVGRGLNVRQSVMGMGHSMRSVLSSAYSSVEQALINCRHELFHRLLKTTMAVSATDPIKVTRFLRNLMIVCAPYERLPRLFDWILAEDAAVPPLLSVASSASLPTSQLARGSAAAPSKRVDKVEIVEILCVFFYESLVGGGAISRELIQHIFNASEVGELFTLSVRYKELQEQDNKESKTLGLCCSAATCIAKILDRLMLTIVKGANQSLACSREPKLGSRFLGMLKRVETQYPGVSGKVFGFVFSEVLLNPTVFGLDPRSDGGNDPTAEPLTARGSGVASGGPPSPQESLSKASGKNFMSSLSRSSTSSKTLMAEKYGTPYFFSVFRDIFLNIIDGSLFAHTPEFAIYNVVVARAKPVWDSFWKELASWTQIETASLTEHALQWARHESLRGTDMFREAEEEFLKHVVDLVEKNAISIDLNTDDGFFLDKFVDEGRRLQTANKAKEQVVMEEVIGIATAHKARKGSSSSMNELQFLPGDKISVFSIADGWGRGRLNDKIGSFPLDHVDLLLTSAKTKLANRTLSEELAMLMQTRMREFQTYLADSLSDEPLLFWHEVTVFSTSGNGSERSPTLTRSDPGQSRLSTSGDRAAAAVEANESLHGFCTRLYARFVANNAPAQIAFSHDSCQQMKEALDSREPEELLDALEALMSECLTMLHDKAMNFLEERETKKQYSGSGPLPTAISSSNAGQMSSGLSGSTGKIPLTKKLFPDREKKLSPPSPSSDNDVSPRKKSLFSRARGETTRSSASPPTATNKITDAAAGEGRSRSRSWAPQADSASIFRKRATSPPPRTPDSGRLPTMQRVESLLRKGKFSKKVSYDLKDSFVSKDGNSSVRLYVALLESLELKGRKLESKLEQCTSLLDDSIPQAVASAFYKGEINSKEKVEEMMALLEADMDLFLNEFDQGK